MQQRFQDRNRKPGRSHGYDTSNELPARQSPLLSKRSTAQRRRGDSIPRSQRLAVAITLPGTIDLNYTDSPKGRAIKYMLHERPANLLAVPMHSHTMMLLLSTAVLSKT